MTNFSHAAATMADLGGHHLHNHNLHHSKPSAIHHTNPRSTKDDPVLGTTRPTEGAGSGLSASEELTNEGDEEDDSDAHEDEQEGDEEDEDALAPSRGSGKGKGKGKRPAIRIEPACDDESDEETTSCETAPKAGKPSEGQLGLNNKKRTFSNLSSTSLLFGDDDASTHTFPRPKIARRLSHTNGTGLLAYQATGDDDANRLENAIMSSDDETEERAEKAITDDDDDYAGLTEILEDESDLDKIEEEEESFIINEEQQQTENLYAKAVRDARRHGLESSGSLFDVGDEIFGTYSDINFGQFFEFEEEPTSPEPTPSRKFSDASTKRVRFDDDVQKSNESSSSSSDSEDDLFPDLFLEQDKLPPSVHQLMEMTNETDEDPLSDASDQDYYEASHGLASNDGTGDMEAEYASSEAGSSGYESDGTDTGDTTEEDDSDGEFRTMPHTPRPKSVLHCPSSAPASRAVTPKPFQRSARAPVPARGTGSARGPPPACGIFIHDDTTEAIAVTNRTTKTLTFYRPRAAPVQGQFTPRSSSASTANSSPRASLQQLNASDGEVNNGVLGNIFLPTSDIMFTGFFGLDPTESFLTTGQTIGPPEAFFPFVSVANGMIIPDDEDFMDDEDFEDDIKLEDFLEMGSDDDETEYQQYDDDETDVPATPATSTIALNGSTPARPTPMAETPVPRRHTTTDAMLEHFDRAGVTAFRNNQNRFRDIACQPYDPNLRHSMSRPIRSGRSADTLMSPLRKRSSIAKKIGGSPFARVNTASDRLQSSLKKKGKGPPMGTFS
ncbi:uncharacterized protein EI97DRAFT_451941 [Westerdykella ornata]|uniref:Uncharacterized protein n=1 Tax=Westerdykella ornata TaxID=318751 RepID=A0A6A6JG25_WESOR|nr:uncharacterized protein EI97DRAFT_451941 [Westerdykella ornata]KAF2274149.1 hypothetical protein EI97DRAFT_451941 [Westerdykella ornata]